MANKRYKAFARLAKAALVSNKLFENFSTVKSQRPPLVPLSQLLQYDQNTAKGNISLYALSQKAERDKRQTNGREMRFRWLMEAMSRQQFNCASNFCLKNLVSVEAEKTKLKLHKPRI